MRKGSPLWNAAKVGGVLARIADEILVAVCAVDRALRAEFDTMEAQLDDIRRTQPNVQFPEGVYECKDPHRRIRHEHDLLCIEAPHLAGRLGNVADALTLPGAAEWRVPAFDLRKPRTRAPRMIDVGLSYAAIVQEARTRGWTPFEDGSADVRSVAHALTGSHCRLGGALLELSTVEPTPGRTAVGELADVVYFAGSRLQAIANLVAGSTNQQGQLAPRIEPSVELVRELGKSLHAFDARIREVCLFDSTPRRSHSADVAYQAALTALADAEFDVPDIARLILPTSKRDRRLWEKRVGDQIRKGDLGR
jgi:hypothetical protein